MSHSKKYNFKKLIGFTLYIVVIVLVFLELAIRFTVVKDTVSGVEYLFGKKHRYLLPFPILNLQEADFESESANPYRVYSSQLGWSHGAWGQAEGDFGESFYSNHRGWRITKEAFEAKQEVGDSVNTIFIGDSFTHGDAVNAEDTWPYILSSQRHWSYANLAVGGYGIDQAFLRLVFEGESADTIIFGVIPGDLERSLDPVYNVYLGGNKTKPIMHFVDDTFSLINYPVLKPLEFEEAKKSADLEIFGSIQGYKPYMYGDTWWSFSYALRAFVSAYHQFKNMSSDKPIYLNSSSDKLDYCVNIFEQFQEYCKTHNAYGLVVLLDNDISFYQKELYGLDNPWDILAGKLDSLGVPNVNFHDSLYNQFLVNKGAVIHAQEHLHYSVNGNKLLARLLNNSIKETNKKTDTLND